MQGRPYTSGNGTDIADANSQQPTNVQPGSHYRHRSHDMSVTIQSSADRPSSRMSGGRSHSRSYTSTLPPDSQFDNLVRSHSNRRQSISESVHTPSARKDRRRSWLSHVQGSAYGSSPLAHVDNQPSCGVRESHLSATDVSSAQNELVTEPSTVWDELDELKSRVRHLEGSGDPPPTSINTTSNSSGDRPRTGTTSGTTVSSSPQQTKKQSIMPVETFGAPDCANIHPLLHSALFKAKGVLNSKIYNALESTGVDALELAAMTGSNNQTAPTAFAGTSGNYGATLSALRAGDRNVRRKADGICRSLTELCIALCEARNMFESPAPTLTRTKGDVSVARLSKSAEASVPQPSKTPSSAVSAKNRVASLSAGLGSEAPPRSSPSRALSRVEARRSSLAALGSGSSNFSSYDSDRSNAHRRTTIDANTSNYLNNRFNKQSDSLHRHTNLPTPAVSNVGRSRPTPSRLGRSDTSLMLRRSSAVGTGNSVSGIAGNRALSTDDEDDDGSYHNGALSQLQRRRYGLRAPSRALTESGRLRPRERERVREHEKGSILSDSVNGNSQGRHLRVSPASHRAYTSQHPLPDQQQSSPLAHSFLSSLSGASENGNANGNYDNGKTGDDHTIDNTGSTSILQSAVSPARRRLLRTNQVASTTTSPTTPSSSPATTILTPNNRRTVNANNNNYNNNNNSMSVDGHDSNRSSSSISRVQSKTLESSTSRSFTLDDSATENWRRRLATLGSGLASSKQASLPSSSSSFRSAATVIGAPRSSHSRLTGPRKNGAHRPASLAG